jgi:hypothetical protein
LSSFAAGGGSAFVFVVAVAFAVAFLFVIPEGNLRLLNPARVLDQDGISGALDKTPSQKPQPDQ